MDAPARLGMAVPAVVLAMTLAAVGNGLLFAFIPVRLREGGFDPAWAGAMLTAMAGGGIAGCLLTGKLVRRLGYPRAFAGMALLILLSNLVIAARIEPFAWTAARTGYGFAICALFIIAQSWLNALLPNHVRGRVMAVFYMAYVVGLGCGSFLLRFVTLETPGAPLIGAGFAFLAAALPLALPAPRAAGGMLDAGFDLRRAWRVSPAAMAGMLAVGGLSMLVTGFAPIHAAAKGFSQADVAALLFAMPLGTVLFQPLLGWVSDRIDRRFVLLGACLCVIGGSVAAFALDGAPLLVLIAVYVVWSGTTESIYSVSTALAGDRADPHEQVALQSALLMAWSLSGFGTLALATLITAKLGSAAFMPVAVAIAAALALFLLRRLKGRAPKASP